MTPKDFENVSNKIKIKLHLLGECIPPPLADILTCTKVNGVKKKHESHLILSFSEFPQSPAARKKSLTLYKLGGTAVNLLIK